MEEAYCPSCRRITGHKRALGLGTLIGSVVTLGGLVNFIPFYPKRCVVCGVKLGSESAQPSFEAPPEQRKTCPDCAEEIKLEARVCRFCGRQFEPPHTTEDTEPGSDPSAQRFWERWEDLNAAWRAAIIKDTCPRCQSSQALEIQGADFRCKTCSAVFPRPAQFGRITFACPTCGIPVTPARPICPKCGIRVHLSRPA